ncbi:MAG: hypothetical protein VKO44_00200 [Cyanobacteriota bacterium]|nr:hypothetical protein [Cyanobacteriota bacterium]
MGVALEDRAFDLACDTFDLRLSHGSLSLSESKQGSLAWFLFNLLKRLQDLGTCPAVDWSRYRAVLSRIG